MTAKQPEHPEEWGAMEQALEAYFLARDRGEDLDVLSACNGDHELAARVLEVLGDAPDLVVDSDSSESTDSAPLTSFGDFDIVEQIGKGGMGTVYLAMQRSLGREVALKVLDGAGLEMDASRMRMRREAELTALLDHPGIVPVYAVGEVGEVPFIAMKYLLGPSLADVQRPWAPEQVAKIAVQLAEALDAAHVHGVVHRDVKPANIIMDGDSPVFVDFGLARAQSDVTLTQEGKVAGTLRYMAPERLDASSAVLDPRVDIYGLGATLYELLAAREVFGEQSPTALVRSVLARDPAPLRLRGRHHDLETIVMRALSKDPRHRFATARDMADDLRRYLNNEPVTSRRMSRAARAWRTMLRYPRSSSLLAVAALLIAVSASAFLVVSSNSQADRDRRLTSAQTQLREQRHERARDGMLLLAQRHPDDTEVAEWLALAEAEVAIDKLLVLATDYATDIEPKLIANLTAVARSTPAGDRGPIVTLAAAVALAQSGDPAGARQQLATLPTPVENGRTATVIRAWLDDEELPWSLPAANASAQPDAVMLTTMVMYIAGAPPQDLVAELELLTVEQRQSPRMIFLEAVARGREGQWQVAASLLRGLSRNESWPATWRWLASIQLKMGQLEDATESLRHCQAHHAGPIQYLRLQHAYEIARRAKDLTAQRQVINALRAKPARSRYEELFLAEHDGKVDASRVPDSLARLAELQDASVNINERERLLAYRISIAGNHLPSKGDGTAELHKQYLEEWLPRAKTLKNRVSRSLASSWIARSLCLTGKPGDLDAGMELFRATCLESPGMQDAAADYAKAVLALPSAVDQSARLHHVLAARGAVDTILQRIGAKHMGAAPDFVNELRYYGFFLVWRSGDYVELKRRIEEVKDLLPESVLAGARQAAEVGKKAREQLRKL